MDEIIAEFSIEQQESVEANFEMEQNQGTRDHEQLVNRDKPNQHPISSITGLDDALFPIVVNNSGNDAPSSQPQSINEKYLCKNERKLYVVGERYILKEGVTNSADFNSQDGSVSGFASGKGTFLQDSFFNWGTNFDFKIHFKLNQNIDASSTYYLFYSIYTNTQNVNYITWLTIKNGKIHLTTYKGNYIFDKDIVNTELQTNIDYYLHISKEETSLRTTFAIENYDEDVLEDNSFVAPTNAVGGTKISCAFSFGCYVTKSPAQPNYQLASSGFFTIGTIYLEDSYGEIVEKSSSVLTWISQDLGNKKIYLDILNSILFFYVDNNLISIQNA